MIAKVLGIRRGIDFTTDDGKHIKGTNLYIAYRDPNVEGFVVKRQFVSDDISCSHIVPNTDYDFIFESNFYGRASLSRIDEVVTFD